MYLLIINDNIDIGVYQYQKFETLPTYESLKSQFPEDLYYSVEYRVIDVTECREIGWLKLSESGNVGSGCLKTA